MINFSIYEVPKELSDEIDTEIVMEDWIAGDLKGLTQEDFQFELSSIIDEYILSGDISWGFWEGFELPEGIDSCIHDIPYLSLRKQFKASISSFDLVIQRNLIILIIKLEYLELILV